MTGRSLPPSLKELVDRQSREKEERARPRYMAREERERLALERLEQQRKADGTAAGMGLVSADTTRYLQPSYAKSQRKSDRRLRFDWDKNDDTSHPTDGSLYVRPTCETSAVMEADTRHWSEKPLSDMRERDWRIVREDYVITLQGASTAPLRSWRELRGMGVSEKLIERVESLFDQPTPIQRQVIPCAMDDRDVIGLAETGSGKTLSFLIPCLARIAASKRFSADPSLAQDGPYALVIVPTRELAQQIEQVARRLATPDLKMAVLVGGHKLEEQAFGMRTGAELVIGTPGRLKDFCERHLLVFNQCSTLVLDEADRMVDMNFEEDLNYLLDLFPSGQRRQAMLFSATMPPAIEKIARTYLGKPIATVTIGEIGSAPDTVEQRVLILPDEHSKLPRLTALLPGLGVDSAPSAEEFKPPIIVFVNQKATVDFLTERLARLGVRVAGLHGGKGQEQREAAIQAVKTGQKHVLVATDVAGRGIDIPQVSLIVNYDMAKSIEAYLHRVGRTGRAGLLGTAVTLLTEADRDLFYELRQCLQRSPRSSVPPELEQHEAARVRPGTITQQRKRDIVTAFGI